MRLIDIFRIAFRMLRTNFLRTSLTVTAIATAIGLIVVLVSLGYGVQDLTIGSILRSKSLLSLDVFTNPNNVPPLNQEVVDSFTKLPSVSEVSPIMTTEGQITYHDNLISNVFVAANENYLAIEGVTISEGRSYKNNTDEIILSPQALQLLGTDKTILNKTIDFKFVHPQTKNDLVTISRPLTVVGITDENSTNIYAPYSLISPISNVSMTSARVVGKDKKSVIDAQKSIENKGYIVDSTLDVLASAEKVFYWVTFTLVIIAIIALVVAAIGMFNTLTITLLERTHEIGIMKALGLNNRAIQKLFLAEAVIIGFAGGILGIVFGVIANLALNSIINNIAVIYGGSPVTLFKYPDNLLINLILYPLILGFITGLYPAIRASKINPLNALRYE